jgi:competence protein ComEC
VTRLLPAHLVVLACVAGLVLADLVRLHALLAVLAGCAALAAVGPRVPGPVAVAVALALAGSWWWGSVRLDGLDRSVLVARIGTGGRMVAVTTAEARPGAFAQRQFARLRSIDGERLDERVELELPRGRAPPQGAVVDLIAVVKAPRGPSGGFDERTWLRRQGVHVVLHVDAWSVVGRRHGLGALADRLRGFLRRGSAPGLGGQRRALVQGVVLGDDRGLSDGVKQSFRRSGLYHLLAVSGQNVVLLAGGVLGLCVLLGVGRVWGHLGALAAIGAYVLAVGPQPSVIRAAVAGAAVSVAWLLGRLRDHWHVLLLAAVVLLAWNPYALFDAGFQLSFAAVAAIFLIGRPLARELEGYPLPPGLRGGLAISIACTIATAPLLWLEFGRVPVYGVLGNALVEPAVPPLLALAFAAAAVDPLFPAAAHLLAACNGLVAVYVLACARLVGGLPGAQVSGRAAAVAAAAGMLLVAFCLRGLSARRATRP